MSTRKARDVREMQLQLLKNALEDGNVESERRFYVSLPTNEAHQQIHFTGPIAGMVQKVHPVLAEKIEELVKDGYSDAAEVQRYLEQFVKQHFGFTAPDKTNRSYYPTTTDVRNHMYKARLGLQFSKLDQVNLQEKIQQWEKEGRDDKYFFRPYTFNSQKGSPAKVEETSSEEFTATFLWVHQTTWQQDLMKKYGNHISLIDATYKTTRYELPLFFVCVRTNVGYCVVAEFIVQTEGMTAIKEALDILRTWNPQWNPPFFMCDCSEAEIAALEMTFPGITVYVCDFHREQAWTRWVHDRKSGLQREEGDELLSLLRECARAPSGSEAEGYDYHFKEAVKKLRSSAVWWQHDNVRRWLNGTWLSNQKVGISILALAVKLYSYIHVQYYVKGGMLTIAAAALSNNMQSLIQWGGMWCCR